MLLVKSPASTSRATRRARCRAAARARATARARTMGVPMAMFVTRTVWQAGRGGACIRAIPGPSRRLQVAQHRFVGHSVVRGRLQGHVPWQRQVEGACVSGRRLFLSVSGHGGGRQGQQARQQNQGRSHHGRVRGRMCAVTIDGVERILGARGGGGMSVGWQRVSVCVTVCRADVEPSRSGRIIHCGTARRARPASVPSGAFCLSHDAILPIRSIATRSVADRRRARPHSGG